MTSRSLLFALGIPLSLTACVDTQELGDPQDTDGGSAGETEVPTTDAPTTDTPDPDETDGETDGESEGETDGSVHDDCVELIWSCPSDDLVCLPEGLCVPCAEEGESPDSAEGGHCCSGLVQTADGTACVPQPSTDACLPPGALCGYAGTTQPCCEGSVCNPDTDLCEPDGSKGSAVCADYEPPGIDNCAAGGKSSASFSLDGPAVEGTIELDCVVGTPSTDGDEESLPLDCDGDGYTLFYSSAAPHLVAPVAEDDNVRLTLNDFEKTPGPQPSFSLRTPGGELIVAFVNHFYLDEDLPVALDEFTISYGETGCGAFSAKAAFCEEGESILSGHISVQLGGDEGAAEPLQAGGTTSFAHGGRTYDLIVHEANEIVCWDESCAGDEGGPFDHLQMLIVAQ
jgi:hypothetical protein